MVEATPDEPRNINVLHRSHLSLNDKIALNVTRAVGSMYAVYFFLLVMGCWMLWQGPLSSQPFDPYPFAFLLFIANIVQLLLMPLILVGQNLQGRHSELRSEEEYRTTKRSFAEIEELKRKLDKQTKLIEELKNKLT